MLKIITCFPSCVITGKIVENPVAFTVDILLVKEPPPSKGNINTSPFILYNPVISISGTVRPIRKVLKIMLLN